MRKAEAAGTEECPVKIKLVAPPLYVLTTQTLDKVNQLLRAILTLFGNVSGVLSGYQPVNMEATQLVVGL